MLRLIEDVHEVYLSKEAIEADLAKYKSIVVTASQQVEDGWIVVLEGTRFELDNLALEWEEAGVL